MSEYTDLIRQHIAYDQEAGTLTWKENSELGRKGESAIVEVTVKWIPRKRVVIGCEVYEAADVCWFLWKGEWPKRNIHFLSKDDTSLRAINLYYKKSGLSFRTNPDVIVPRDVLKQVYRALPSGDLRNAVVQAFLRNEGVERCP